MTQRITEELLQAWSSGNKIKRTPSGWISGNAPCCHNRGQSVDRRGRGGLMIAPDGGFTWNCFNCGFTAAWHPGVLLSKKAKDLLKWSGVPDSQIQALSLESLKIKNQNPGELPVSQAPAVLVPKNLPPESKRIKEWLDEGTTDPVFLSVLDYLINERRVDLDWYDWHWTPIPGYNDRVIIPFYANGGLIGYTARRITDKHPKYLTEDQKGYVFNIDRQTYERQFVLVTEGPFDAIAVEGVAVLHNTVSQEQAARINQLKKPVIVVPDRHKSGVDLINDAIKQGWSVSFPLWEAHIKDAADAVKEYGRLYTLISILHYQETNPVKIEVLKKRIYSRFRDQ